MAQAQNRSAVRPKKRFHHGDLREALIAATRELLIEHGPDGFTLADACRRAGVTTAAPYKHFRDKQEILEEIVLRGFAELTAANTKAVAEGGPGTIAGITASLDGIDPQLEAAALTLGASRLQAMREIVLPLAAPGVLSALIFAFIVSFGDVYIALFLTGPGMTTLPIEIFSYMQWESTPVIAAITSLQIVLILVLGLIVERLVGLRHIMRF